MTIGILPFSISDNRSGFVFQVPPPTMIIPWPGFNLLVFRIIRAQKKIIYSIIQFVFVLVVNNLVSLEKSSDAFLHHKSVLWNIILLGSVWVGVVLNIPVTTDYYSTTDPSPVSVHGMSASSYQCFRNLSPNRYWHWSFFLSCFHGYLC